MRKLATNSEYYVLVGAAGLSALISILDFLGLLESFSWLAVRIPTLILLLVSMILGYLVVERKSKLEAIETLIQAGRQETLTSVEEGVNHIITSLQGVHVRLSEDREKMFASIEHGIKQARHSIDTTHFVLKAPGGEIPSGQQYYDTFSEVVKGGRIKVRRIVLVQELEHLDWIRQMLTEFAGCPFFLGCYPHSFHAIPMINLLIIDGEKLWLGGGDSYEGRTISAKHSLLIKLFQEYFDKLWRDSMRLNERGVRDDLLTQLSITLQQPETESHGNSHN
jgi:hypothetical protein